MERIERGWWKPVLAAAFVEPRYLLGAITDRSGRSTHKVAYCHKGCWCPEQKEITVSAFRRWIKRTNAKFQI